MQEEPIQKFELPDREITGCRGRISLFSHNTDSNIGSLNHSYIIASIANS